MSGDIRSYQPNKAEHTAIRLLYDPTHPICMRVGTQKQDILVGGNYQYTLIEQSTVASLILDIHIV